MLSSKFWACLAVLEQVTYYVTRNLKPQLAQVWYATVTKCKGVGGARLVISLRTVTMLYTEQKLNADCTPQYYIVVTYEVLYNGQQIIGTYLNFSLLLTSLVKPVRIKHLYRCLWDTYLFGVDGVLVCSDARVRRSIEINPMFSGLRGVLKCCCNGFYLLCTRLVNIYIQH